MSNADEPVDTVTRKAVERRIKELKDEELVAFIRDTVVRLDLLADRLENMADKKEGE